LIYHRPHKVMGSAGRIEMKIYLLAVESLVDSDEEGKFDPSRAKQEGSISQKAATAF